MDDHGIDCTSLQIAEGRSNPHNGFSGQLFSILDALPATAGGGSGSGSSWPGLLVENAFRRCYVPMSGRLLLVTRRLYGEA